MTKKLTKDNLQVELKKIYEQKSDDYKYLWLVTNDPERYDKPMWEHLFNTFVGEGISIKTIMLSEYHRAITVEKEVVAQTNNGLETYLYYSLGTLYFDGIKVVDSGFGQSQERMNRDEQCDGVINILQAFTNKYNEFPSIIEAK